MKQSRVLGKVLSFLLCGLMLFSQASTLRAKAATGFRYVHDPRLSAKTMAEVVVDPQAVYGFSPALTGSLATYAKFDWTDPEEVAEIREERLTYLDGYQELDRLLSEMASEGKSTEEIARAVSAKRNEIRLAAYADDPEMLATVKERNLATYGHEEGPLPDELFEKYGSWEKVMERAFALNPGVDACVGLYDDYYEYYVAFGYLEDENTAEASREHTVASFVEATGLSGEGTMDAFLDAGAVHEWYQDSIRVAVGAGILKGYEDATIRPQNSIRRIEALVLLSRCLPHLPAVQEAIPFSDLPDWAKDDVDRLTQVGLVKGYGNGKLGADDLLTVEQVRILVGRITESAAQNGGAENLE